MSNNPLIIFQLREEYLWVPIPCLVCTKKFLLQLMDMVNMVSHVSYILFADLPSPI